MNPEELSKLTDAVIQVESGGRTDARSKTGAVGLMQLNPNSFPDYTPEQLSDPDLNVALGTEYLDSLVSKYGNVDDALSAYHAGPGNFDKWVEAGRPVEGLGAYGPNSLAYASKVRAAMDAGSPEPAQPTEQVSLTPEEASPAAPDEEPDPLVKQFKYEYFNPNNMVEYHPDLINYARVYYNDNHSSNEDIASRVVSTMRNFENSFGTAYYLNDVANASEDRKRAFGHMLNYWAEAPDMIDYISQGDVGDAFEAFGANLLRGVFDPINLVSAAAGAASGGVGAAAIQGAAATGRKVAIQSALKALAAGFITDATLSGAQSVGQQQTQIAAQIRDNVDYGEAAVVGLIGGTLSQAPAVASSIYRGIKPRTFKSVLGDVTDADNVPAAPITGEMAAMETMKRHQLPDHLVNSINVSKFSDPQTAEDVLFQATNYLLENPSAVGMLDSAPPLSHPFEKMWSDSYTAEQLQPFMDTNKDAIRFLRHTVNNSLQAASRLDEIAKGLLRDGMSPDAEEYIDVMSARNLAWFNAAQFLSRTSKAANNASLALHAFKEIMPSRFDQRSAAQLMQNTKTSDDITAALDNLRKGKPIDATTFDSVTGKLSKGFMEAWYNGILGAFDTIVMNTLGSWMNGAIENYVERPLAASISKGMEAAGISKLGFQRTISGDEVKLAAQTFAKAHTKAMRVAWEFSRIGQPLERIGVKIADAEQKVADLTARNVTGKELTDAKIELDYLRDMQSTMRSIGSSEFADEATNRQHIPWWLGGHLVRLPGTLMSATDAFNRTIGYDVARQVWSVRKAFNDGLTPGTPEFRAKALEYASNPTEKDLKVIREQARAMTFQDNNDMSKIIREAQNQPYLGPVVRLFMPFARTPVNLVRWGAKRTPGVGLLFKDVPIEERLGRQIVGTSLIMMGYLGAEHGYFSGGGHEDWSVNAGRSTTSGWQPYARVRTDEKGVTTYSDFARLDPVAWLIQGGIVLRDILSYADKLPADEAERTRHFADAFFGELRKASQLLVTDRTYLSGLADMMKVFSGEKDMSGWIAQTLSGVVPNYIARVGQTSDEWSRSSGRNNELLADIWEKVKSRIPGLREELPTRVNMFGRPVQERQGVFFGAEGTVGNLIPLSRVQQPSYVRFKEDAPLVDVVNKLNIKDTPWTKNLYDIDVNTYEQARLRQITGELFRMGLNNNLDEVQELMRTNAPAAKVLVDTIQSQAKTLGKTYFLYADPFLTQDRRNEFLDAYAKSQVKDLIDPSELRQDITDVGYRSPPVPGEQ